MTSNLAASLYLISGVLFILALRGLSSPESSRKGNFFGILGMTLAIIVTFLLTNILFSSFLFILCAFAIGGSIGVIIAYRISMTAMPQLVAGFHSLVGLAAVLVALSAFYNPEAFELGTLNNIKTASLIEMSIGASIGAITFTGSIIAFLKLQGLMSGTPIVFKGQHFINLSIGIGIVSLIVYVTINQSNYIFWALIIISFFIGVLLIIPIGGADMPVVISMLNSYSGWAAAGIGFTLKNTALIITGALVGSSGAILSYIMCKGMNRSFFSVILGGFGGTESALQKSKNRKPVKSGNAEDAAFLMKNASSVIIVPGYGMAVAQAQHAVREMADNLKKNGVKVSYAVHPVAGRMPGHMNVLLAEANYESILKMVGTIYGKQETSKQVLRASWVFDVCWRVHNRIGTTFKYAKEAKIPTTQTIKNYVKTKHYKENYKLFMGRDWLDLKAIKNGKDPVDQHVKNCNAIIISDLGKKLMNVLIVNGGQYPLIDPKHKEEDYLKELKKVMTEPGHDPGPLDDWGSFENFSNDPEYLRDKKSKENYFKGKYKK